MPEAFSETRSKTGSDTRSKTGSEPKSPQGSVLTHEQRVLSHRFLAYRFLSNLFFISAVWLYFYRLFVTDAQVGVLDGMAFFIGIVAEVPSGVLADRFGRGRITRWGLVLTGLGFLIQAFGSSFLPFFVGQSIMMIGVSLTSGADDALFFARLNFEADSLHWRKLVTRGSQLALIGTLGATLLGGWLHTINPRVPWILTGLAFVGSAWLLWRVNDTAATKEKLAVGKELSHHVKDITEGFKAFRTPNLFCYVPFILTVQALFYTTSWGLLRIVLLDRFHFDPLEGSILVSVCAVLTVMSLFLMHRYAEKFNEKWVLSLIAFSAAASLLASVADIGKWGGSVIFALYAGECILYPFLSELLNKQAREEQRATLLSVASFFKALPYVALAPLIGALNTQGRLDYFLVAWAVLIAGALAFYLAHKKRHGLSLSLPDDEAEPRMTPPDNQKN